MASFPGSKTLFVVADVHRRTTSFLVRSADRREVARMTVATEASHLKRFVAGLGGDVCLAFEEGSQAAWLYDLWKPLTRRIVVCDPRRNRLLADGSKSDDIDLDKLSELQMNDSLRPVYHGDHGTRRLKQLAASYREIVEDGVRVKNRIKAIFRSRGIDTDEDGIYDVANRQVWLEKLEFPGDRERADRHYRQLAVLLELRSEAEKALREESRHHAPVRLLRTIPGIGDIRAAEIVAIVDTPFRFRTKSQFWAYCGFGLVTRSTADYVVEGGTVRRRPRPAQTRGLNRNFNRRLKDVFKGAALVAIRGEMAPAFERLVRNGTREQLARLTIARKIAALALAVWKTGVPFDAEKMNREAGIEETETSRS